jgi:4a-hydroxytetrahydrobiopterin dehydratase
MEVPEGWAEIEGALQREFRFKDFSAAINFVNRLAEVAETARHHPDISIHWNRVVVRWWTQAAQAITDRDAELAAQTDGLAKGGRGRALCRAGGAEGAQTQRSDNVSLAGRTAFANPRARRDAAASLELASLLLDVTGTLSDRGELPDALPSDAKRCGDARAGVRSPPTPSKRSAYTFETLRLQLVLGDDRAEVSLYDLERLENRPLRQELGVILRALAVVAAARILGWKMSDGIPAPAARCCGIGVDGGCQLVVATVAHVAKAVEMSVLRLDEPEPRVPERVGPAQGLEQRRVHLASAVRSESRLLPKTLDSVDVTANEPGTRCGPEPTHLSRRRSLGHGSAVRVCQDEEPADESLTKAPVIASGEPGSGA